MNYIHVSQSETYCAGVRGYSYEVADADGAVIVAEGWAAGSRAHVREEAKVHARRVLDARAKAEAAAVTGEGL